MNLYLAAASADRFAARLWIDWLNANGHTCHDWTRHPGYTNHDRFSPSEIIESNLDALRQAEAFIYLVSETPSTGAGHELGWAVRAGLPCCCVKLCEEFPPQNVSVHQDGVQWVDSVAEALEWFEEQPEDPHAWSQESHPAEAVLERVMDLYRDYIEEVTAWKRTGRIGSKPEFNTNELLCIVSGVPF